jgi:hypothetical protein
MIPRFPMNERYSFFALARHAVNGRKPWPRVLHRPTLQPAYDAVIIGGGGHGLRLRISSRKSTA